MKLNDESSAPDSYAADIEPDDIEFFGKGTVIGGVYKIVPVQKNDPLQDSSL